MSDRRWTQDSDRRWLYEGAPDMFGYRRLLGEVTHHPPSKSGLYLGTYWTSVHRQMQRSFVTLEEAKAHVVNAVGR